MTVTDATVVTERLVTLTEEIIRQREAIHALREAIMFAMVLWGAYYVVKETQWVH